MSCEKFEKLIPLYVEGDLRPRQMNGVRTHLSSCLACCKTVESYRATQRWLREAAVAQVPAAALDRMRAGVSRRIDAVPPPAAFWRELERGWALLRQWASQPAVSVAAVFVVVLGSVAVSQVVGPRGGRSELVERTAAEQLGSPNVATMGHGDGELSQEAFADRGETTGGPADEVAVDRLLAQASTDELGDGAGEPSGHAPARDDAEDDEMRIEIQTRDPNVRIIWFTPPEKTGAVEN